MPPPGPGDPEVHQITDAMPAHSDDLEARMARYLVSMLIRTICVVLVLVVDGWPRWIFVAGAVGLPYVAVIFANNSGRPRGRPAALGTPQPRTPGLSGSSQTAAGPAAATSATSSPALLTGVVRSPPQDARAGPVPDAAVRPAGDAERLRDTA